MRRAVLAVLCGYTLLMVAGCGQSATALSGTGVAPGATVTGTLTGTPPPGGTSTGPGGGAAHVRPTVRPRDGHPRSTFVVRFVSRARLGTRGVLSTAYRIVVGGRPGAGCLAHAEMTVGSAGVGSRVRVAFAPGVAGWCRGRFRGVIDLVSGPHCTTGTMCPEFASRLVVVGRFRWHVA